MNAANSLGATLTEPEHEIAVGGLALQLAPGVFPPDRFPSTGILLEWAQEHIPIGARILELGTGCGAIAVALALRRGVTGLACDISSRAVDNARANARRHGVDERIAVLLSDVFAGLPRDSSPFEVIIWNSPFMRGEPDAPADEFQDPGYAAFGRFFGGLAAQLTPGGRAYLGFGSIGDFGLLSAKAATHGWSLHERHSVAIHEPAGSFDYAVIEVVANDADS